MASQYFTGKSCGIIIVFPEKLSTIVGFQKNDNCGWRQPSNCMSEIHFWHTIQRSSGVENALTIGINTVSFPLVN